MAIVSLDANTSINWSSTGKDSFSEFSRNLLICNLSYNSSVFKIKLTGVSTIRSSTYFNNFNVYSSFSARVIPKFNTLDYVVFYKSKSLSEFSRNLLICNLSYNSSVFKIKPASEIFIYSLIKNYYSLYTVQQVKIKPTGVSTIKSSTYFNNFDVYSSFSARVIQFQIYNELKNVPSKFIVNFIDGRNKLLDTIRYLNFWT